jgi:hypothetical protein
VAFERGGHPPVDFIARLAALVPKSRVNLTRYRCIPPDQRGYNLSGKPKEVDAYRANLLIGDAVAIAAYFSQTRHSPWWATTGAPRLHGGCRIKPYSLAVSKTSRSLFPT